MSEWMTHCFLGLTKAISSSSESVTWVLEAGVTMRGEVDLGASLDPMCMPQIAIAE